MGKDLPNPKIRHSKEAGPGVVYHLLSWEGLDEVSDVWLNQSFFTLQSDLGIDSSQVSSCNTRKVNCMKYFKLELNVSGSRQKIKKTQCRYFPWCFSMWYRPIFWRTFPLWVCISGNAFVKKEGCNLCPQWDKNCNYFAMFSKIMNFEAPFSD